MEKPKFCKDCKYANTTLNSYSLWLCQHSESEKQPVYNLLTGGLLNSNRFHYCSTMREGSGLIGCGREALLFEPKETRISVSSEEGKDPCAGKDGTLGDRL